MTESQIQSGIVVFLRGAGIFCHSCPNEGAGSDVRRHGKLTTMGLFPGVADLIVWWPTGIGYLEVKTETGHLSAAQEKFRDRCATYGVRYDVVRSVADLTNLMEGATL